MVKNLIKSFKYCVESYNYSIVVVSFLVLLENSKNCFKNAPIHKVSIDKIWIKLTNTLQNSWCLVFNDILKYVYWGNWGNSNTRKLSELQIKLPEDNQTREKFIKYVLSAFSLNYLPTNYL
jgi:hypothetical protein